MLLPGERILSYTYASTDTHLRWRCHLRHESLFKVELRFRTILQPHDI